MLTDTSILPTDVSALFLELFKPASLYKVFEEKFAYASSKGVDRLNGFQYAKRAVDDTVIASQKCTSGTYRFSPYLENLKVKGRGKPPRLISIPTVRDRLVLHQLNKLLAAVFPESVPRNIANSNVRKIASDLHAKSPATTYVCGCDIKTFYDAIQRDRLLALVERRINSTEALSLIEHALLTPTVTKSARRSHYKTFKTKHGVPQGLAISNILAAIYLQDVDVAMEKMGVTYFRYVDDVLIYGEEEHVRKANRSLGARLRFRGLSLHPISSGKSHIGPLTSSFGYLGYYFVWPKVTVRETTIERLLQSLSAKFSDYMHNKERRLSKFKYLTKDRLAEIFLIELNERITGAISEKRRYGWIAYFSQINDLTLLHRLDNTVSKLFGRLSDFGHKAPSNLKTFRRAYFEMKFNPTGGYVRNYDAIASCGEKLAFLVERGRVAPTETLTDEEINARFESYRHHVLSAMHSDEGKIYG